MGGAGGAWVRGGGDTREVDAGAGGAPSPAFNKMEVRC
jgi:hypothetical protein